MMVTYSKLFKDPQMKLVYSNIMNRKDASEDPDDKLLLFVFEVRSLGELVCTAAVISTDVVKAAKKLKKKIQENLDDRYNYHITPMVVTEIYNGANICQINKEKIYVSDEIGED